MFPAVTTFGYMHALLFRDQHSALRSLSRGFDPQYLLTAGSSVLNYILEHSFFTKSSILELGSPRSFSPTTSSLVSIPSSVSSVLVLPEGILHESLLLLNLV